MHEYLLETGGISSGILTALESFYLPLALIAADANRQLIKSAGIVAIERLIGQANLIYSMIQGAGIELPRTSTFDRTNVTLSDRGNSNLTVTTAAGAIISQGSISAIEPPPTLAPIVVEEDDDDDFYMEEEPVNMKFDEDE